MLRKTSALPSLSAFQCGCPLISTTSPSSLPQPRTRPNWNAQIRTYADVRPDLSWPAHGSNTPTPYDIFHLERGEAYSKRRFYELVKLYHPDRHGHAETHIDGVSHAVKLERYRLVILAHEILSDPIKRREYDRNGAGWVARNERWTRESQKYPTGGRPFGFGAGYDASPFGNATWEDWERWHERTSGDSAQQYEGNYISPNGFASIIILLAVISGVAQATRAGQYSLSLEDKARSVSEENQHFMRDRAGKANELRSDGRVRQFLEKRDPTKYGLKDEEGDAYKRTFPERLLPPPGDSLPTPAESST